MYFVFFFQAEDGIRDLYVTGVQTCALPIYWVSLPWEDRYTFAISILPRQTHPIQPARITAAVPIWTVPDRSEERRVGKECRSRGAPDDEKKKRSEEMDSATSD